MIDEDVHEGQSLQETIADLTYNTLAIAVMSYRWTRYYLVGAWDYVVCALDNFIHRAEYAEQIKKMSEPQVYEAEYLDEDGDLIISEKFVADSMRGAGRIVIETGTQLKAFQALVGPENGGWRLRFDSKASAHVS